MTDHTRTFNRDQLAALLAHHADVLAAQLRTDPARDAHIAAERLDAHAAALTADEETPAVAELLDSMLTFDGDEMAASLVRDGFGDDEIAAMLPAAPAAVVGGVSGTGQ